MEYSTNHSVIHSDARNLSAVQDESVDLVVTSPPYPMIEMWDGIFSSLNGNIQEALNAKDGDKAFELMHSELQCVWEEINRVIKPNGIVCINIGDATRKIGEEFQLYPNHARIIEDFRDIGFSTLPDILWRKPTNKSSKFMGSGMIPPNAYVTLEHEYILVFRKGGTRTHYNKQDRYESAYFWEERNEWFSDVWSGLTGAEQNLTDANRDRSAAFPVEIPRRLIQMYSIQKDTVLDPFLGTGTTTLAAALTGRNSIGYDIDESLLDLLNNRLENLSSISKSYIENRIDSHKKFVEDSDREFKYTSEKYGFPVTTNYETDICFHHSELIETIDDTFKIHHSEYRNK